MLVIPIRTETSIRRTPIANYGLMGANCLLFVLFSDGLAGEPLLAFKSRYLVFHADQPALHEYFTYQFLHGGIMHLLGNMLFLWVFGNAVNMKLGDVPFLVFYLAGGVFAAWGYAVMSPGPSNLVGASGSIAAVTTAFLVLFPRARVTVLVWLFIFIHFFEWPAMLIIGLKIIVWDNIVAPNLGMHDAVAYTAHLAGYLFGFLGALGMLLVRAVPRDQFDILALWKRWNQRRALASTLSDPAAAAKAQYGSVARVPSTDPQQEAAETERLDEITDLRTRIGEQLEGGDVAAAVVLYEQFAAIDSKQCLSERHQLQIARDFYGNARFPQAADAFERFVACYRNSSETDNVRLLLGIIYARDLSQYENADKHLTRSMATLRAGARREQCVEWLRNVRIALGRPAPDVQ